MNNLSLVKLSSLLLLSLYSFSSFAAMNEISIEGELTDQTCSLLVNGSGNKNPVITLEPVHASNLKDPGSTAGRKNFSIGVTGCVAKPETTPLWINFFAYNEGDYNEDNFTTIIGNVGTAKNVDLQLLSYYTDPVNGVPIKFAGANYVDTVGVFFLREGETSATTEFGVEYISEQGNAAPGSVTGVVQFAVDYD